MTHTRTTITASALTLALIFQLVFTFPVWPVFIEHNLLRQKDVYSSKHNTFQENDIHICPCCLATVYDHGHNGRLNHSDYKCLTSLIESDMCCSRRTTKSDVAIVLIAAFYFLTQSYKPVNKNYYRISSPLSHIINIFLLFIGSIGPSNIRGQISYYVYTNG